MLETARALTAGPPLRNSYGNKAIVDADGEPLYAELAVLRLLQHLGALPDPLPTRLSSFLRTPVQNTRGETVGEVLPAQ